MKEQTRLYLIKAGKEIIEQAKETGDAETEKKVMRAVQALQAYKPDTYDKNLVLNG